LEVYSLSGQFIMRSSESSLNLNKMVSGNYFLLIKNEKKQVIHRQAFRLN
jgi:hypothetical protein